MTESCYYLVKVKIHIIDDGKAKDATEQHLVKAVSVVDCDVKINEHYENMMHDWQIVSVAETKIMDVIE